MTRIILFLGNLTSLLNKFLCIFCSNSSALPYSSLSLSLLLFSSFSFSLTLFPSLSLFPHSFFSTSLSLSLPLGPLSPFVPTSSLSISPSSIYFFLPFLYISPSLFLSLPYLSLSRPLIYSIIRSSDVELWKHFIRILIYFLPHRTTKLNNTRSDHTYHANIKHHQDNTSEPIDDEVIRHGNDQNHLAKIHCELGCRIKLV